MTSSAHDDGATAAPGEQDGGSILVLKVWRESGFRARITVQHPQEASSSRTVLADSESAVVDFIGRWLGATDGP